MRSKKSKCNKSRQLDEETKKRKKQEKREIFPNISEFGEFRSSNKALLEKYHFPKKIIHFPDNWPQFKSKCICW